MLLAVITLCAVWIAAQQMLIARQKLNHDLFDRRFAVFTATQAYLVVCLSRDAGTQQDTEAFYAATRAAPFLFKKDINDFLALVMKYSIDIQVFGRHLNNPSLPDYQKFVDLHHKGQLWAADAYSNIVAKFHPSMNLLNLKPFPMAEIVSIPDAQTLRDRITATFKAREDEVP
jgi:hypothetical protein